MDWDEELARVAAALEGSLARTREKPREEWGPGTVPA